MDANIYLDAEHSLSGKTRPVSGVGTPITANHTGVNLTLRPSEDFVHGAPKIQSGNLRYALFPEAIPLLIYPDFVRISRFFTRWTYCFALA